MRVPTVVAIVYVIAMVAVVFGLRFVGNPRTPLNRGATVPRGGWICVELGSSSVWVHSPR